MPLDLENLRYVYARGTAFETVALQDLSLHIDDGEFVGVMGRTGCGKSTLLALIAGLAVPTEGRILFDGQDINASDCDRMALRRKVGVVFQYPEYQLFETTVERDVGFSLRRFGFSKEETLYRTKAALELVGFDFEKVRALSPLGLSGGEKRRVAIAGVLAAEPKLLMLDEPVAGLDPQGREKFLSLLDGLNAAGTTILMISHNADALAEHAKRILALKDGRCILDGTATEIFAEPERLRENGLGVCQTAALAEQLKQNGVDIGAVTKYDALLNALTERAAKK